MSSLVCPAGASTGPQVLSMLVGPGAPAKPSLAWCAPITGNGAPITTTTDGMNESIVWYMTAQPAPDGGAATTSALRGVNGDSGQTVYDGNEACGVIQKWVSPIAVKGRLVVGASGRLCAYSAP
jgi:hypothetical protein